MGLVEELLGCSLLQIDRSYWAVRLKNGEWLCEARSTFDVRTGPRPFDWSLDLTANGDVLNIDQLWLFCPPTQTSPLGNTAHLTITEPGTAFQFKVATVDTNLADTSRQVQAHIIGRVTDKLTGACECFIFDPHEGGLLTPDTQVYDHATHGPAGYRDEQGEWHWRFAGQTSVYDFASWRPGIARLGRLELDTVGLRL